MCDISSLVLISYTCIIKVMYVHKVLICVRFHILNSVPNKYYMQCLSLIPYAYVSKFLQFLIDATTSISTNQNCRIYSLIVQFHFLW